MTNKRNRLLTKVSAATSTDWPRAMTICHTFKRVGTWSNSSCRQQPSTRNRARRLLTNKPTSVLLHARRGRKTLAKWSTLKTQSRFVRYRLKNSVEREGLEQTHAARLRHGVTMCLACRKAST